LSGIRTLDLIVLLTYLWLVVDSYHYTSGSYINIKSRVIMMVIHSGLPIDYKSL